MEHSVGSDQFRIYRGSGPLYQFSNDRSIHVEGDTWAIRIESDLPVERSTVVAEVMTREIELPRRDAQGAPEAE